MSKPRVGRTPDLLRKGGPQRDRTKYHRPGIDVPAIDEECRECGVKLYHEDQTRCQCCGELTFNEE